MPERCVPRRPPEGGTCRENTSKPQRHPASAPRGDNGNRDDRNDASAGVTPEHLCLFHDERT